jgi:hypothetical protein
MSTDRRGYGPAFRIFRGEQRAIGECMIEPAMADDKTSTRQCLGYAAFTVKLKQDPNFTCWFTQLGKDIDELAAQSEPSYGRLITLQRELIDLMNFLDDPPRRFPAKLRTKLSD